MWYCLWGVFLFRKCGHECLHIYTLYFLRRISGLPAVWFHFASSVLRHSCYRMISPVQLMYKMPVADESILIGWHPEKQWKKLAIKFAIKKTNWCNNTFRAETVFIHHILTSTAIIFWRIKTVPALKKIIIFIMAVDPEHRYSKEAKKANLWWFQIVKKTW